MMIELKNITTEFMVDDIEASIDFYRKLLGFEIVVTEPKENPFFVILKNGDVELMLYNRKQFSEEISKFEKMKIGGTVALYIGVEKIDTFYKSVKNEVRIIQKLHSTDYDSTEFSCEDNSGYVLMFSEKK